ncbi:hypothetical protein F3Y22_tig00111708pilonHSYRG00088 [Hibiscus syriacus]|uniref:AtC3H23-like CCCH zinc finger domain-containing protein n=1 Tax=Hibiscus syriacus TaxID=106335 RepID=A0A6A2XHA9_HIBSY|nr:hypothetical protein F3Y22_tig00111708pilonHSYRG00088 [Hibiscus syriacus]
MSQAYGTEGELVRTHGSDGVTALHCAVAGGSFCWTEVVRILLDAGADTNLLDAGADTNSLDANGNRLADLIALTRNSALGLKKKMLESLLKRSGCDGKIEGLPEEIEGCNSMTQVTPCLRAYSHDWTECPFVHPGESARRRDPRKYLYSCIPCPEFRKGSFEYAHGSAMPSPISYSATGSSLDMGSMSPHASRTGSRMKNARRVRNMEFDMEQLELESCRRRQTQQLIDEMAGNSSTTNWNNPLSIISTSGESNRFGRIPLDTSTHQAQSLTGASYMTNLTSSPIRASQSFGVDPSRPLVGTILSPTAFANRWSSFMELTSLNNHSGFSSPTVVPCNFSDWGSPNGKLDWVIHEEEVNNATQASCYAFQINLGDPTRSMSSTSDEPDVSWVQSLVKDTTSEQFSFEDEQHEQQFSLW